MPGNDRIVALHAPDHARHSQEWRGPGACLCSCGVSLGFTPEQCRDAYERPRQDDEPTKVTKRGASRDGS